MTTAPILKSPPRSLRGPLGVAGAAAVIGAAALGWSVGSSLKAPAPAARGEPTFVIGGMELARPARWRSAPVGDAGPEAQRFQPQPGLPARVTVSLGPPADDSLVPAALRERLPRRLPSPARATVAGLDAWSYALVSVGRRMAQVTVAPTTHGSLTVTCASPAWSWSAVENCHRQLAAADLGDVEALRPASDLPFRSDAADIVPRFDRERAAGRAELRSARRPNARARAARALWRLHAATARSLSRAAATRPSAHVVAALGAAARAYRALGRAANGGDRAAYVAARRAIQRADARLRLGLAALTG